MPTVVVRSLPAEPWRIKACLKGVNEQLAAALGCAPEGVWSSFVPMTRMFVGQENRSFKGHCPIVTVRARPRPQAEVAAGLEAVARAVAEGLKIPLEDVWVHWEELPEGRVFAGGQLH